MLLTQDEFDDLPQEAQDALRAVVRQPTHDQKDHRYRLKHGKYMNGDLGGDPIVRSVVGYGAVQPPVARPLPIP